MARTASLFIWSVVLIVLLAIWIRGEFRHDALTLDAAGHMIIVGSFPNHIDLLIYRDGNFRGKRIDLSLNETFVYPMGVFWQLRFASDPKRFELAVPWWLLTLFVIATLGRSVLLRLRARRRQTRGCCANCGYDLRASTDICPECGKPIATAATITGDPDESPKPSHPPA